MCARRVLRSHSGSDVAKSALPRREDERQGELGLDPELASEGDALAKIHRLSREVATLKMQLAQASGASRRQSPTYRGYSAARGWVDKVDLIAEAASHFADQLAAVRCIRMSEADNSDAKAVNSFIAMIAKEADALVSALIRDAEAHGLEASGPWMKIPLFEVPEFEVPDRS